MGKLFIESYSFDSDGEEADLVLAPRWVCAPESRLTRQLQFSRSVGFQAVNELIGFLTHS